MEAANCPKNPQ